MRGSSIPRRCPSPNAWDWSSLVRIPDLKVEVQGNGMATTRAYIKSNRDVVKSALKGYVEGIYSIFQ